MEKIITGTLIGVLVVGAALGFYWLAWKLWLFVLPQLWEGGPANIIAPGYWLFCGAFFLIAIVGRAIFGGSSK